MNDDLCGEAKARIEQLTLERDKFLSGWNELRQELYHADVSIEALTAERDAADALIEAQAKDHASNNIRFAEATYRAEKAEADNARLREALERIADWPSYRLPSAPDIARAALNTGKAPARSDAPATDLANQIIDEFIAEADIDPGDQAVAGAAQKGDSHE